MSQLQRVGDLEIAENMAVQRGFWAAQRIAWGVAVLLVLAAVLGLFGPGLLSKVKARSSTGELQAEYHRFVRFQAPAQLRLQIDPALVSRAAVELWMQQKLAEAYQIQDVTPQPESVRLESDRVVYRFIASQPQGPMMITFHLKTQSIGSQTGQIGVVDGPSVQVSQFIYP